MATPLPPPAQRPRRLTLRELQERKRKAEEAYGICKDLIDQWHEEHSDALRSGSWPQLVAQLEREMEGPLAVMRAAVPSGRAQLADVLLSWSGCFFETSDRRRTVYTLREAIDLIAPLTTREEQRVLASCVSGLGQVYAENGWLDEARAMLLESLAMQHNAGPLRVMVLSKLANVQVQMGQLVEALESARATDVFEALGQEEECWKYQVLATASVGERNGPDATQCDIRYRTRMARQMLREGSIAAAESAIEPKRPLNYYEWLLTVGQLPCCGMDLTVKLLRVNVDILRAMCQDERAALLEADLDETDAIIKCYNEAILNEVLTELRAERAAEAAAAAAGGGGGGGGGAAGSASASSTAPAKKKPSRKQQKRKAAQRRKAEERAALAAAVAAAAAAAAAGEEEEKGPDDRQEQQEGVTAVDTTPRAPPPPQEEEQEEEQEPELEPEECAMCLNELPPPGADGAVLLACSHTFHVECLGRWKDKCLEKGLWFTCPMCRGAVVVVVVVAGGAGEGKETK